MSAMYLNNPLRTLELRVPPASEGDIEATYAGLRDAALAIVWPSLRGSSAWSIECRPLLGGITNSIYLLSLRGGEQGQHTVSSVIARLFGNGTELFVDRYQTTYPERRDTRRPHQPSPCLPACLPACLPVCLSVCL